MRRTPVNRLSVPRVRRTFDDEGELIGDIRCVADVLMHPVLQPEQHVLLDAWRRIRAWVVDIATYADLRSIDRRPTAQATTTAVRNDSRDALIQACLVKCRFSCTSTQKWVHTPASPGLISW